MNSKSSCLSPLPRAEGAGTLMCDPEIYLHKLESRKAETVQLQHFPMASKAWFSPQHPSENQPNPSCLHSVQLPSREGSCSFYLHVVSMETLEHTGRLEPGTQEQAPDRTLTISGTGASGPGPSLSGCEAPEEFYTV